MPGVRGILKPRIVMFGENLDPEVLGQADAVARACDVFIAVGTSLQVFPVAGLPYNAVRTGAKLIIVNGEPTPYDEAAAEVIREPISQALPKLVRRLVLERA